MSPAVQIRLLGEFSVAVDGVAVGGLNSARLQALLGYLLLNRAAPPVAPATGLSLLA